MSHIIEIVVCDLHELFEAADETIGAMNGRLPNRVSGSAESSRSWPHLSSAWRREFASRQRRAPATGSHASAPPMA